MEQIIQELKAYIEVLNNRKETLFKHAEYLNMDGDTKGSEASKWRALECSTIIYELQLIVTYYEKLKDIKTPDIKGEEVLIARYSHLINNFINNNKL